jgi:predicted dehydrogenase
MRIAVIGVGRMGRRHIIAAREMGYEVVGIFDPLPQSIDLARTEQNISEELCFASAADLLEKTKPDGIVVASTAPSHCEYVCLASMAGVKYILCEKPMATSLDDCDRMIEACSRTGSVLAVNHQMRFMEQYSKVKELVDSEKFGGLRSVTVAASNFGLAMNGCHYFEMFRYLTGQGLKSVTFHMDEGIVANPRGPEFTDRSGQLFGTNELNQRFYMEIGNDLGHGVNVVYGCRFGQIFVDEVTGFVRTTVRQDVYRDLPTTRYGMPADVETMAIAPADVIKPTQAVWEAMKKGYNYPDGACGRQAVATLVAALVSGEERGRPVTTSSELPMERTFPWA